MDIQDSRPKNYPKEKTVIVDGYTVHLVFNDLINVQQALENLIDWHIKNDKG